MLRAVAFRLVVLLWWGDVVGVGGVGVAIEWGVGI
jgi:hypothetical protein